MSFPYTFSTNPGFITEENVASLISDISSRIENTVVSHETSGDTITIVLQNQLSITDSAIIWSIFIAHDPPIPELPRSEAFIENGIIKHIIDNVTVSFIGSQTNEVHISKQTQGHFTSLKAAITANPYPDCVFVVHPGDYIEDNPITMLPGTVIRAEGNAENTFITAQNTDEVILNMNVKCKVLGVTLRGGSTGVYFNQAISGGYGRYSAMMECFVVNCIVGIDCDGNGIMQAGGMADTLYAREIVVSSTVRPLSKGIQLRRGGQFISSGVTVFGVPPMGPYPAVPISYGYYGTDAGSKFAMSTSNCYFCGAGLYLDAGCSSELTLLTLKYNGAGTVIGGGAGSTRFSVNSLEITGSVGNDITVLSGSALVEVHSGILDDTKISNPGGSRLNMKYHTNKNGKTRQRMLGIINVGTPSEPAKMIIGEGNYDVFSLAVIRNNDGESGTWTNCTADALEDSGNPFSLFSGVTAGNCLYIGRSATPVGIKLNVLVSTTSVVSASSIVYEYWNGTDWISFPVMQTEDTEPFYYVANACISTAGSYHIRFGLKSNAPLVAKTLGGFTKKWVRIRVVNDLPSVPTSEYILAHTNSMKIGSDGYTEYYGDSRTVKKLSWNLYDMLSSAAIAQNIYYSKSLASAGVSIPAGGSISLNAFVPTDIDSGFNIKLVCAILCDASGDVNFSISYGFSNIGADIFTDSASAPATAPEEIAVAATTTVTAGKEGRVSVLIPISHVNMNPSGQGPQTMWVGMKRAADDAYTGTIVLSQISGYYVSWIDGAHLFAF